MASELLPGLEEAARLVEGLEAIARGLVRVHNLYRRDAETLSAARLTIRKRITTLEKEGTKNGGS